MEQIKNKTMTIGGFPPQRKNAIKKGHKLEFKNKRGVLLATVQNNCRSDENGECRVCMSVDKFELCLEDEPNIVSRCD